MATGHDDQLDDQLDVDRLMRALHEADCKANGLGMHEAGDPDQWCSMMAGPIAAEYDRLSKVAEA